MAHHPFEGGASPLAGDGNNKKTDDRLEQYEIHLRRLAIGLVNHLPEGPDEARRVLAYASSLIDDWMAPPHRDEAASDDDPFTRGPSLKVVR
jgi:hypothetical protein